MAVDPDTQEIVECFVAESREALEEAELILLGLEGADSPEEELGAVFRLFHSVKGSAGYLEFQSVGRVMHVAETFLGGIQAGKYPLDSAAIDSFCRTLDFLGDRLDAIGEDFVDEGEEARANSLKMELEGLMAGGAQSAQSAQSAQDTALESDLESTASEATASESSEPQSSELLSAEPQSAEPQSAEPHSTVPELGVSSEEQQLADFLLTMEQGLVCIQAGLDAWRSHGNVSSLGPSQECTMELLELVTTRGYVELQVYLSRVAGVYKQLTSGDVVAAPEIISALAETPDVVRCALDCLPNAPGVGELASLLEGLSSSTRAAQENVRRTRLGLMLIERAWIRPQELEEMLACKTPLGEEVVRRGLITPEQLTEVLEEQQVRRGGKTSAKKRSAQTRRPRKQSLRVDVGKLDQLMDLVGELIISEIAVAHDASKKSNELEKAMAQLSRVTRSLQDVAMSLRMVPIDDTFRKMVRLVRDVSAKQGKQVNLLIVGEDTEVDKTVAEVIADPLVHLMRNALDHGMEPPDERRRIGKEAVGTLRLEAQHQAGEILITVSDDGRGMKRSAILTKAIAKGLIAPDACAGLSDAEVYAFIFEPGFSTAETVTDISGRGVGMDVVRRNIEKIKGRIEVHSKEGEGTRFTLRIPLTLSIIAGMLVRVGGSSYTIPLLSIRESVVLNSADITCLNNGQEVARVRDELIPILRLKRFYGLDDGLDSLQEGVLVVVQDGTNVVCLFVDELVGERQTVVKALAPCLGDLRGLSGCTVLGDGGISLILDIGDVIQSIAA